MTRLQKLQITLKPLEIKDFNKFVKCGEPKCANIL